jgi:hypothetical protein
MFQTGRFRYQQGITSPLGLIAKRAIPAMQPENAAFVRNSGSRSILNGSPAIAIVLFRFLASTMSLLSFKYSIGESRKCAFNAPFPVGMNLRKFVNPKLNSSESRIISGTKWTFFFVIVKFTPTFSHSSFAKRMALTALSKLPRHRMKSLDSESGHSKLMTSLLIFPESARHFSFVSNEPFDVTSTIGKISFAASIMVMASFRTKNSPPERWHKDVFKLPASRKTLVSSSRVSSCTKFPA